MKKQVIIGLISAILFGGIVFNAAAQESADSKSNRTERTYKNEFNESEISYRNVTVYKVLDHKDAYIVMYAKGHREVGNVAIPKKWYKESPRKLGFRKLSVGMTPYMTVFYRNGNFDQVVLTMPVSRADFAWGVADSNVQVDASKDTFDIVY